MEMMSCPFCQSLKIAVSDKTSSEVRHISLFCETCHAYGPRVNYRINKSEADALRSALHIGYFKPLPANAKIYNLQHDKNTLYNYDEIKDKAIEVWNARS